MIVALAIGTVLAIAALCYVLYPLFFGVAPGRHAPPAVPLHGTSEGGDEAVAVLREIEFDRETGKLAEGDYAELKTAWTARALAAMRAADAAKTTGTVAVAVPGETMLDAAELAIRRARAHAVACAECGPRPEPDAAYCSECGRWLNGSCAACGAAVTGEGARFCAECGTALAA